MIPMEIEKIVRGKGFYKLDGQELLYAPNSVMLSGRELYVDSKDEHIYPIDGWWYFNDELEAKILIT